MLREAISYLFTRCPARSRALGYLYESLALEARAKRCLASWQSHLENCHVLVREAIDLCSRRNSVLILGSGLLLETPMEDVLAAFSRVICLDMVHLAPVRKQYAARGVQFMCEDATGLAEAVHAAVRGGKAPELTVRAPKLFDQVAFDLVISSNLLSQLPLALLGVLRNKGWFAEEELRQLARDLISAHCRWLRQSPGVSCLISDTRREYSDPNGSLAKENALYGLVLKGVMREWWWDIAPSPELGGDLSQRNLVVGMADCRTGGLSVAPEA